MNVKPRVVIDTQIFLRAAANPRSLVHKILLAMTDRYHLIFSKEIRAEIHHVLHRPELRKKFPHLTDEVASRVLTRLDAADLIVLPDPVPQVSRDPKDDIFIACAVEGKADFLVSEDKDLLDIGEHEGVRVINVPTFFSIINPPEQEDDKE